MRKKTPAMLRAEARWEKPVEVAMVEALNERRPDGTARSMGEAADALGLPRSTFLFWMGRLRVEYEAPAPIARLAQLAS